MDWGWILLLELPTNPAMHSRGETEEKERIPWHRRVEQVNCLEDNTCALLRNAQEPGIQDQGIQNLSLAKIWILLEQLPPRTHFTPAFPNTHSQEHSLNPHPPSNQMSPLASPHVGKS